MSDFGSLAHSKWDCKYHIELHQVNEHIKSQSSRENDDYDNHDGEGNFSNVNLLAAFEAAHSYQASGSTGAL